MRLANPEFLLLFLLFIPLVWLYVARERGKRPAVLFSDCALISKVHKKTYWQHLPMVLNCIGMGLLIVALARPQKGHTEQEITTMGVDIMLVLDVSTSMKALDFKPSNRLIVAKETISEFIKKRVNDRMGLVIFSGRSFTKCPLTLDYALLLQFIKDIQFGEIEDGTAIGTAIATAATRLRESKAKSRVLILTTDGANNRGEITPTVAAKAAAELGIKIYTIGVGVEGAVPYPVEMANPWTGQTETRVQMIQSDLDEKTLQEIATVTKGTFFRATDAKALERIYDQIDKLEKSEIKTKSFTTYTEYFFPWLLWGCALCVAGLVLGHTRFKRIP